MQSLLRPRDTDALRAELRYVAAEGSVPVLFGGEVHGDTLLLTELLGTRTAMLRGLAVRSSSGLGGASMVAGRPMSVADYRSASSITHDYDAPVLSEGIKSVLAVPVVVDGTARAMLYGAYRAGAPIGDR
ncbi:MAG: helix-turn-helix transcriptional regulator, partial [Mycobacterium sp.]